MKNIGQEHLIKQINLWLKQRGFNRALSVDGACLEFTALWIEFAQMNQLPILKKWYSEISSWDPGSNPTINPEIDNHRFWDVVLDKQNRDVDEAVLRVLDHLNKLKKPGNLVDQIQPDRIDQIQPDRIDQIQPDRTKNNKFQEEKPANNLVLNSEMCISFVFNEEQLKDTLKLLLGFSHGKKILLNYPEHAIALYCEDNKYVLYNPSQPEGELAFDSLDEVIKYYIQALNCESDSIGLAIHVVDLSTATYKFDSQHGGLTFLRKICTESEIEIGLQKESADTTALMIAAQNGDLKSLTDILQYSFIDVNELSADGLTALSIACENGHLDCVKALIGHGAEVNLPLSGNRSALYVAAENNQAQVIKYLLGLDNIDMEMLTEDNTTALHVAVTENFTEVALLLLKHGANPNIIARGDKSVSLFYWACDNGNFELVKAMAANQNVDVNAPMEDLSTPIHTACLNGHHEIVSFLLTNGANVNSPDENGSTPLHYACEKGDLKMVKLLLDNGANIHAELNDTDEAPWDIADNLGYEEIKDVLEAHAKGQSIYGGYQNNLWQSPTSNTNINSVTDESVERKPPSKRQRE